jgi:hypothetical protein
VAPDAINTTQGLTRRVPLSNAQSRDSHCTDGDNSGLMATSPFMDGFHTVDKLVQRQIRKTRRT